MTKPLPPARPGPTRRTAMLGLAASTLVGQGGVQAAASDSVPLRLAVEKRRVALRPPPAPETEVLAFADAALAPTLRAETGRGIKLALANGAPLPLALHAHGHLGASTADGVGGLTQAPVASGGEAVVDLGTPLPGTYLLRPLVIGASAEAAERGLAALLVVPEASPPAADADVALLVDDWSIGESGALEPFRSDPRSAAGRLGNVLTVNGRPEAQRLTVAPGARIRLRLANAANARILPIRFDGLAARVAAIDSRPTDTFEPLDGTLPFPPGRRYDVFVRAPAAPGTTGAVVAVLGSRALPLLEVTSDGAMRTAAAPAPDEGLAPDPRLPVEIRLQDAKRQDVVLRGGGEQALPWTVNGAAGALSSAPLVEVKRGTPVVLSLINETPATQVMHLHGHAVRLLHALDDGWEPYWLDTIQIPPGKTSRIAFVADNPGRWLIGSTILERLDGGLWTWFAVT